MDSLIPIKEQLITLRETFFEKSEIFFQDLAKPLGFPKNPGMSLFVDDNKNYFWMQFKSYDKYLKVREIQVPPDTQPKNYFEILFGDSPKIQEIERVFYQSKEDGFFSFYIEDFKNVVFLPNPISEFLQIYCHFCTDITFLEVFRETLFVTLITYSYLMQFRLCLAWFISINPYTFPLIYLLSLVDWAEDWSYGFLPTFRGISFATPLLMAAVGKATDLLNHLVFTMPYLPSEGHPSHVLTPNGSVESYIYFRYLPILWYKYPIPNELREYWYTERPDVLEYLQKAYENVDIQFLPDRVIGLNLEIESTNILLTDNVTQLQHFSHYYDSSWIVSLSSLFHLSY